MTCGECKTEFEQWSGPGRPRRYCSKQCKRKACDRAYAASHAEAMSRKRHARYVRWKGSQPRSSPPEERMEHPVLYTRPLRDSEKTELRGYGLDLDGCHITYRP